MNSCFALPISNISMTCEFYLFSAMCTFKCQIVTGDLKEAYIKTILNVNLVDVIKSKLNENLCSTELIVQLIAEMAKTGLICLIMLIDSCY